MNSRKKGTRGELEARDEIRKHLGLPETIRAGQVSGKFAADLLTDTRLHLEVKFHNRIAALRFLRQAERDAGLEKLPVVVMRENGSKDWVLMMRLEDFKAVAKELA